MQETYYVSLDPGSRHWHVSPFTHEFPETHWVFPVSARSEQDAILKGLEQYKTLTLLPTASEMAVLRAVANQVGQIKRVASETLIVQLDYKWVNDAQSLAQKGFFDVAHQDELIIQTSSAGWKAIQEHVARPPARIPEPISYAYA